MSDNTEEGNNTDSHHDNSVLRSNLQSTPGPSSCHSINLKLSSPQAPWKGKRKRSARGYTAINKRWNPQPTVLFHASTSPIANQHPMWQNTPDDLPSSLSGEAEESLLLQHGPFSTSDLDSEEVESGESSSNDEDDFNLDDSVPHLTDWMKTMPSRDRKKIAVLLYHHLHKMYEPDKTKAAQSAGLALGYSRQTIYKWVRQYCRNGGEFATSERGKYRRDTVLDQEDVTRKAVRWLREKVHDRKFNLTHKRFQTWLNEYLQKLEFPDTIKKNVSEATAFRYMKRLGFTHRRYKQGYADGHEREDEVEYRKLYLKKVKIFEASHLPPPTCEDNISSWNSGSNSRAKNVVFIYHDETTFNAYDAKPSVWVDPCGSSEVRPKGKGQGIMISDFIDEFSGYLRLTDEEHRAVQREYPFCPKEARRITEHQRDGYWDNAKFMNQIKAAAMIAQFKYPREKYDLVWIFDHSSGHQAYNDNALVATRMNVKPGGNQPVMRDWRLPNGNLQEMCLPNGTPKGLELVLRERGVDTTGMVKIDMVRRLQQFEDFKNEVSSVEAYLKSKNHRCLFSPKFHPELNPIERCWGKAKQYARSNCNYTMNGLRETVPIALESVTVDLIRQYFRKVRDYHKAYIEGMMTGNEAVKQVNIYKAHRKVSQNN